VGPVCRPEVFLQFAITPKWIHSMNFELTPVEEQRYAELQQLALDFARRGAVRELTSMLDHGLPVNLSDLKGNSLLMLACYHGHEELVRDLVSRGARVDEQNHRGQTPLGGAAFKGYAGIVQLLLEAGADARADQGNGATPVMFAAMFGRTEVVAILRRHASAGAGRDRFGPIASALAQVTAMIQRLIPRGTVQRG
jgi:hypothetical protein